MSVTYEDVMKYWFGEDLASLKTDPYQPRFQLWYSSGIDEELRTKFGEVLKKAENDELNDWKGVADGEMALIILMDQFSRNIYRGSADSFKNDAKALELAKNIIDNPAKHDQYSTFEKKFIYMPLMHSEDVAMQKLCVKKIEELEKTVADSHKGAIAMNLKYGREHCEIVEKYEF